MREPPPAAPLLGTTIHDVQPAEVVAHRLGWAGLIHRRPGHGDWQGDEAGLARWLAPLRAAGVRLTWHYPVVHAPTDGRPAVAPAWWEGETARTAEWARFEADLGAARRLGAATVVLHFVNRPLDQPTKGIDEGLLHEHLQHLAALQATAGLTLCLECFTDPWWLAAQAARHGLGICLDSGHLATALRQMGNFSAERYLAAAAHLAPLVPVVHLWNTRGNPAEHHVPVHPDQQPEAGWLPIPSLLDRVRAHAPTAALIAEPSLRLHPRERFWAGMAWVAARWGESPAIVV